MKNITVSVPEEVYRQARIRAAEAGTSVSALVNKYLRGLSDQNTFAEMASKQRRIQSQVRRFSAHGRLPRDEVYIPEGLKKELAELAKRESRSEADLIRLGIERLLEAKQPAPRLPLFASRKPDLAENVDEALTGYGE